MTSSNSTRWTRSLLCMPGFLACAFLILFTVPSVLASDQKVSAENLVRHTSPAVAYMADGTTVYVWTSRVFEDAREEIFARRYDSAGFPLSEPFLVNASPTGSQFLPDVDGDGSGGFVVTWKEAIDNDPETVWGRVFASDDSPVSGNILISETAFAGFTTRPEVAVHSDGSFVVVWSSFAIDGSGMGVAGRRFDASGNALTPELVLNEQTEGSQLRPNLTMAGDGDFLVTWHDPGIQGRFFALDGTPQSGDFELANISNFFNYTDVAMAPDGRFAVTYILNSPTFTPFIQRFDASGMPLEGPIALSDDTDVAKEEPAIAAHSNGTYHVAWETLLQGAADDVFARTVLADGTLEGAAEVKVNQLSTEQARAPDVTSNATGGPIYTWQRGFVRDQIYTNCEGLGECAIFSDGFESGSATAWSAVSPP